MGCNYHTDRDQGCEEGLAEYAEMFIDPIRTLLTDYPLVPVAIIIEPGGPLLMSLPPCSDVCNAAVGWPAHVVYYQPDFIGAQVRFHGLRRASSMSGVQYLPRTLPTWSAYVMRSQRCIKRDLTLSSM